LRAPNINVRASHPGAPLGAQPEDVAGDIRMLREGLQAHATSLSELKKAASSSQHTLQSTLTQTQQELKTLRDKVMQLAEEKDRLEAQEKEDVSTAKQAIQDVAEELQALNQREFTNQQKLSSELGSVKQSVVHLRHEGEDIRRELRAKDQTANRNLQALDHKLSSIVEQVGNMTDKVGELQVALEHLKRVTDAGILEAKDDVSDHRKHMQSLINKIESKLGVLEGHKRRSLQMQEHLQAQVEGLHTNLARATNELTLLKGRFDRGDVTARQNLPPAQALSVRHSPHSGGLRLPQQQQQQQDPFQTVSTANLKEGPQSRGASGQQGGAAGGVASNRSQVSYTSTSMLGGGPGPGGAPSGAVVRPPPPAGMIGSTPNLPMPPIFHHPHMQMPPRYG